MKIIVCASMSFAKETLEAKLQLESAGHEVIVPAEIHRYMDGTAPDNKEEKKELDVIRNYFHKIEESDAVLVLNYEKKGIPGYIGGNSFLEMGFAYVLRKPIYCLNPLPNMIYTDELEVMEPIILDGGLDTLCKKPL